MTRFSEGIRGKSCSVVTEQVFQYKKAQKLSKSLCLFQNHCIPSSSKCRTLNPAEINGTKEKSTQLSPQTDKQGPFLMFLSTKYKQK